ncbi:MAG TPA: DUF5107 domain-containing protein [Anaerolineae bacterium]|nr:DUF5107 domain-containing protein [Anaerolineae bacterium]
MRSLVMAVLLMALVPMPDPGPAQAPAAQVYTTTLTIPTYPYAAFLETHHSDTYNIDYPWLDRPAYEASNPQPIPRSYTAVVLENQWLRLTFLPELGGRLYGITDKATGEELLYQNPVIKPTTWGPDEPGEEQRWWLAAGGVEWCLPVDEHGYEWAMPWGYETEVRSEGARITLWDSKATDRIRAEITVFLPANKAAFELRPWLVNPTGSPVTFKFWHNAMLAPGAPNTVGPDLRFVLPIDEVTVHSSGNFGEHEVLSWPEHSGVDYSRLGNWDGWLGFFARPGAAEDWAGVYDGATRRGLARVFPRGAAPGVKGFGFGWRSPISWTEWTNDGSTYVELHGGAAPTFWDTITLEPLQTLAWTETWLPVRDLPALSWANDKVAVGLEAGDGVLHLGILSPQAHTATVQLWRRSDCTLLWQEDAVSLSPGAAAWRDVGGLGVGPEGLLVAVLSGDEFLAATDDRVCWPPRSRVEPLAAVTGTTSFWVHWNGTDMGGGLDGYDVQVRDGDATAPWIDWQVDTPLTVGLFDGEEGHTYAFRSRVRDLAGNVEAWPANNWDDAFTTVLLQPAPVLITSSKVVQPLAVNPGDRLEFQVHVINTGSLAANATMTDALPDWLALANQPWSTAGNPPSVDGETITWSGEVPAGGAVSIGFEAWLSFGPPGGVVSNTAWINDGLHPARAVQAVARVWQRMYVPLVMR